PESIPTPSFNPAYAINVCQNGNNLTGGMASPGLSQKLAGTVSGQQVNFTTTTKFNLNSQGIKIVDNLTDTSHGTIHGNTITGNVSSNWRLAATGQGVNVTCGCNLTGTFTVALNGSGGGGGGGGGSEPKTRDVSQTSGIAKQDVETSGVQWTDINK